MIELRAHADCDHPAWCAETGLGDPEAAPVRREPEGTLLERLAPETELERRARDGDR